MVIEPNKPTFGLRLIAVFEAVKGLLGLAVGIGLQALALNASNGFLLGVVGKMHLRSSLHLPHFIPSSREVLAHPGEYHLELWAMVLMAYAALRFVEAYGLWLARRWGEWLALVSAALYLPFEVYWIVQHFNWLKIVLLALNVALVVYLLIVFVATRKRRALAMAAFAGAGGGQSPHGAVPR
jgi:uncharacterized membrane protein (DUF2068 family)